MYYYRKEMHHGREQAGRFISNACLKEGRLLRERKKMREVAIDGRKIGMGHPAYIIAEMSANHLQDLGRAKDIIRAARESGADAVKLQTYRPDTLTLDVRGEEFLATPGSPWDGMNLYELYQTSYTPWEWHEELFGYARELGITCFSTPFDLTAVDFLHGFDLPAYKIASYEINDIPLIRRAAREGKPMILSTGIAGLEDIARAVEACHTEGNEQLILLKCVSEYPTPYEDLNLRTMGNMGEVFGCLVGLSDHSLGNCVSIASVALGGTVIEKHFTLSREDGGPDAMFSMEPAELERLVSDVRNTEKALGQVTYELTDRQKKSRERSRSLYIAKDIRKGEAFTRDNVKSIRPGYGLHTKHYEEILGRHAREDLKKGTPLKWKYIGNESLQTT